MDPVEPTEGIKQNNTITEVKMTNRQRTIRKKGILLSYCNSSDFYQIRFVMELVNQLDEMGFARDVWFDSHEIQMEEFDSPIAHASRLQAAEKCKTAIIVISDAYLRCKWCSTVLHILKIKRRRQLSFRVFVVKFSYTEDDSALRNISTFEPGCYMDLSTEMFKPLSTTEKVVTVLRAFVEYLEIYSTGPSHNEKDDINKYEQTDFKSKNILLWPAKTVLDWLKSLTLTEKCMMLFEELEVKGFQLPFITDAILQEVFSVESKVCRRRILSSISYYVEQSNRSNVWSRFSQCRGKPMMIYLIFDPSDKNLAQLIKDDLKKKGFKVLSHGKLGDTREEFLHENSPEIAKCESIIVLLTKAADKSPFVYHEVIMSLWLQRRIVSLLFHPSLDAMRINMRAILGPRPAIDFHSKLYGDALEILVHDLRGEKTGQAVIYEHSFLRLLSDSIKPLEELTSTDAIQDPASNCQSSVYFSYYWDHQSKVSWLMSYLRDNDIKCTSDMDFVTRSINATTSPNSLSESSQIGGQTNLKGLIENSIRKSSAVILCVSRKYVSCHNRLQEILLADKLSKPIVPVLFEWMHWPPTNISVDLRKILVILDHFDLSTNRTQDRNLPLLTKHVKSLLVNLNKEKVKNDR